MEFPDKYHFTDMDGQPIEDSPEPVPCPFCGSEADQLVLERWSAQDDPDALSTSNVSSADETTRRQPRSSMLQKRGTAAKDERPMPGLGRRLEVTAPR